MVESEVQSSVNNASGGEAAPFESFESLRHAHLELMHSFSDAAAVANQAPSAADKMRAFIARAHATGAAIDDKNERKAAQGILDYWSTELISAPGATPRDFSPARLAPHDVATAVVASEAAPAVDTKLQERSREIIRLVASARLWRDSGRQRGYLLHGDALAEAAKYRDQDPDLSELVSASEADVRQRLQNGIAGAGVAITVLLTLLAASTWLWFAESRSSILAESKTAIAESEKRELERALAEAKEALSKSRRNAEEADQLDRRLQATLAVIRNLVLQKAITLDQLPPDIAAQVKTTTAPTVGFAPEKVDAQTTGYNANFFLSVALPLPVLSATAKAAAFDGGRLINYVNYSLVMNAKRRLALFTASNFDRNDRIVLRRSTDRFTLDPRIPRNVQPEVAWFDSTEIDMGHLTAREEISWGPYFRGDETAASQKLGAMINVFTNVAPQFDTFNRGVWSQLERWMLSEHNKKATRVTIFTGPVLGADDPVVGGSPMPRLFWKIAVSPKADGPRGLVVDAFLITQFDGAKKIGPTRFVPSQFRVRVAEIERLTGLDFGAGVRDAATSDTATASSQEARPNNTVYLQFDGMTREEAIRISNRIQGLGWKIPGEERTRAAANQNEVRYGAEADRPAAELLVADLKSLGLNRVCCAKRNATIKPSILEIWLSR